MGLEKSSFGSDLDTAPVTQYPSQVALLYKTLRLYAHYFTVPWEAARRLSAYMHNMQRVLIMKERRKP